MSFKKSFLSLLVLVTTTTLLLSGCLSKPDFSFTPAIFYKSVKLVKPQSSILASAGDSLVLEITFKDGDGDLGSNDTATKNFFIDIERKQRGQFTAVRFNTTQNMDARFDVLNETKNPIEGELVHGIPFPYVFAATTPLLRKGDTVRFKIAITDRSGKRSNTIETSEVILGKYN
jgi:hypothetical protein